MEPRSGTFVVVHADESAAELRDAESGQVLPLATHPNLEAGEVVEGTVAPADGVGASWELRSVEDRRTVAVTRSEEAPTRQVERAAGEQPVGELTRIERAGTGEVHVITVEAGGTDDAAAEVLDDEVALVARAGRLGVGRVEIRVAEEVAGDADVGVVSVRYLP